MKNWINKFELDYFVITSNINDRFQKTGFDTDKIRELRGSIIHFQGSKPCSDTIWEVNLNPEELEKNVQN